MAYKYKFIPDPGGLDPQQTNYLRAAQRRIQDNYTLGVSQNTDQQTGLRNQYTRGKTDLTREFARARNRLPGSFAKGGTLNSGLYQTAVSRFGQEKASAFSNLAGQYGDERGGLRLARRQLGQVRRMGLKDIAHEESARRAALSSSLRGIS